MQDGHLSTRAAASENYLRTCAPCEDSDQPAHLRSLIKIFAVRILDGQECKVSSCGQRRLKSDCADAQSDLNLRWAHISESISFLSLQVTKFIEYDWSFLTQGFVVYKPQSVSCIWKINIPLFTYFDHAHISNSYLSKLLIKNQYLYLNYFSFVSMPFKDRTELPPMILTFITL